MDCHNCSARLRLKLNTRIGLHTTHHPPITTTTYFLRDSRLSRILRFDMYTSLTSNFLPPPLPIPPIRPSPIPWEGKQKHCLMFSFFNFQIDLGIDIQATSINPYGRRVGQRGLYDIHHCQHKIFLYPLWMSHYFYCLTPFCDKNLHVLKKNLTMILGEIPA